MGQNNGLLDLTSCCVRPRRFRSTLLGKVQAKNHDRKVAGPRRFREACWVLVGVRFSGVGGAEKQFTTEELYGIERWFFPMTNELYRHNLVLWYVHL
jgi:hypothetical protein